MTYMYRVYHGAFFMQKLSQCFIF